MSLQGGRELRARLRALKVAFKPIGKEWAETTTTLARQYAPSRTGRLRASIRVKNASMRRASVKAIYYGHILDTGAKAHDEKPRKGKALRFQAGGRTIFSKKVHKPRQAGSGFAARAARESLRQNPMAATLISEWNAAVKR